MQRTLIIVAVAALVLAGCNQPKGPQTAGVSVVAPDRPVDELMPQPAPRPTPVPVDELSAPTGTDIDIGESFDPQPPAPESRTHTIQKGDTLWSLAVKYLGSGQRWPDIQKANPGMTLAPTKLPVGKTITIPQE